MHYFALRSRVAGLVLVAAAALPAQGIVTVDKAVVLYGSTSNTSRPASVDLEKVRKETPEHETIRSERVRKGSARYQLLTANMHKRIKKAAKEAAKEDGHDCVVREDDVDDDRGLNVVDLTDKVIEHLETDDSRP
ncbi:MAG: hypothetical protein AAF628_13540 [Planctomycetota bacterium]